MVGEDFENLELESPKTLMCGSIVWFIVLPTGISWIRPKNSLKSRESEKAKILKNGIGQ